MNGQNSNKSGKNIKNNVNNKDNISKKQKKKPSKAAGVVGKIFYVNFKILSYLINIVLTVLLIGIITGGIVAGAFALYIKNYIDPTIDDLVTMSSESERTTFLYYYKYEDRFDKTSNYTLEEMDTLHGSQNRMWVKYNDVKDTYIIKAFVALEDKRFFSHNGVDWFRTINAAGTFFLPTSGRILGGSTITQQLVKTMTGDDDTRIQRKIQEILRAMYLESRTSKEDIIETYINTVNLSGGSYGVQAAANKYFNKDASELNLIECAAIASIVQSPTAMNPIRRPENNKRRRDECLKNMLEYGYITQEEFDAAYDKELVLSQSNTTYVEEVKSYYVDLIIDDVTEDLMTKYNWTKEMAQRQIFSGGLKIYTCMDKDIQDCMEYVYSHDEYFPAQSETAIKYESAMVVIDPYNGDLLGIVGGREEKVQRGLNRASGSTRQPGSSIKPISVYAPAIDRGVINWGTPMDDAPANNMIINNKVWPPNLPAGYEGYISLSHAVAVSKNTTAVRTLQKLTPAYSFRYMYEKLNMHSLVETYVLPSGQTKTDIDIAPLALGGMTKGVSVYELTAAYSMLVNKGIYSKPRSYSRVTDKDDNIILDNKPERTIVITEETAAIMTKLLMGVVETGTARGLLMKDKIQVAGKTGTTNEDYDRWFVGYTPYYLCGCWFGYDRNKYLGVGTGADNPPMRLFHFVMDTIHQEIYDNPKQFEVPPTVIEAAYCRDSGMAPGPNCEFDPRGNRVMMGYFAKGTEPTEKCTGHVKVAWDEVTGAVAGPGCPEENIKYISLVVNEDREFIGNPWITDAQYTYREVDEDYVYPTNTGLPFYQNLLPSGRYAGTSGGDRPINSFCVEHNHDLTLPVDMRPEPTSEPVTEEETTEEETTEVTTEEITTEEETTEHLLETEPITEPTTEEIDETIEITMADTVEEITEEPTTEQVQPETPVEPPEINEETMAEIIE